ncbi:MAG: substrate-binding domain-containing protein [Planctomycetota bacterium]|nr:substrate-binding domain-containing protein [Planctomycetota bacterium]
MNRTAFIIFTSLIALVAMVLMLREPGPSGQATEPITVFCAASNRAVIESIRADYEKEFQRSVQVQYGPSQTLLSSIEVSETGDLFLPADESYLEIGRTKNLIAEQIPLATMRAVVAVTKGNPKDIASFADLFRPDVRVVQANPDATAIGKITRATLQLADQWEQLDKATTAYRTTVNDVANDLVVGAADVGIVYDAVLHSYPQLEAVRIAELESAVSTIAIGLISSSQQPANALHFARYVAAKDRGLMHYTEHGFLVVSGDEWSEVPELSLFAGSMLRPVIDDTIKAFEKREGVRVSRVYNGCGILVAQMKAGQHPDAYFACDREFMIQVPDLFPTPVDVSDNELVILVQKGNPENIADLNDLARKGLRIGIGHEKQCAMGWLTQNTLKEGGVQKEVMENVTVQTPTGDMLVNQLRTGSLDAAVVYLSNAAGAGEELDAVRIQGIECSVATQPFAVSTETRYPQLTARLFERLCSAESREFFEAEGFRWQMK